MSVNKSEFELLLHNMKQLQAEYYQFNEKFLIEMGMRALRKTKLLTPVDTGLLRNRWELSNVYLEGDTLYIDLFNPVEYASHVEDGHMQRKRFLPLEYLETSPKGKAIAASAKKTYGKNTKGIMLTDKWIPGHHMARISITQIEQQIPKKYETAFKQWIKELGVE